MPDFTKYKTLLLIIAPLKVVGLSLGIYYAINKEKFTSCTCSKDKISNTGHLRDANAQAPSSQAPPSHETYSYTHNQPKSEEQLKLAPVNDFGPSTINVAGPKEHYSTAYYKAPQNNPETHSRFSGV